MKRLIFFLSIGVGVAGIAGAQYPGYSPFQPAPTWPAPPPSYYYYGQQYYAPQPQQQPQQNARPTEDTVKNKPVEIWLSKGIGRWGDYWFQALGGTNKHPTPTGTYTVKIKHRDFYSNKYDAPMPRSVFFTEQCAIHVGSLRTRSHGCIHVDWDTGQLLYDLAKVGKTKIKVYK